MKEGQGKYWGLNRNGEKEQVRSGSITAKDM